MVETSSTMLPLGTSAPEFSLVDTKGGLVALANSKDAPAALVIFMCNHCPYVKYIIDDLVTLIKEYQAQGVAVFAINSNDVKNYPDDRPEMMAAVAQEKGFTFPYLYDESQEVAKAYQAACTPDFFLFDSEMKLVYRGQMDDSRPGNVNPITGKDLRAALEAVIAGKRISPNQKPSLGCNIKWKEYAAKF